MKIEMLRSSIISRWLKIGSLTLALTVAPGAAVSADDNANVVQWYVASFPPINITVGPNRGQGWGDRRLEIVTRRLPTYRHEVVEASGVRMNEDMKRKPNVCNTGLLKNPEREEYLVFSEPVMWLVPNGAITTHARHAKLKPYVNERGELKLTEFLLGAKARIGTHVSRKYGRGIDAAIEKHAGPQTLIPVPAGAYPAARLLKLANQDEYDIVLGYPAELRYLALEAGLNEKDFVFVTIAEEPNLIPTHIACSKSEFGKRLIAAINKIIVQPDVQNELLTAYKYWLDDKTAARYDRQRQTVGGRKAPGNQSNQ